MDSGVLVFLIIVLQAILFKISNLKERRLQERGISPLTLLYYQRYSIVLAAVLLFITYRPGYLQLISGNIFLILAVLSFSVNFLIARYANFLITNSTSSLSFLSGFNKTVSILLFLLIGMALNRDAPNVNVLAALIILAAALMIKPSQHKVNKRGLFKYPLLITVSLVLVFQILYALDSGIYRFFLQGMDATLFGVGVYTFFSTLGVNVFFFLKKVPAIQKNLAEKYKSSLLAIILLWFFASIPEGFSFFYAPIFTVIATSSIAFLFDVGSDVINKRISFDLRTILFSILVITSVVFSALSL